MTGAQTSGWFSLWGEAGYSRLNNNIIKHDTLPKVYDIHGFGAGLGLGYELHYRKFIATIGLEGNYWSMSTVVDNFQLRTAMIDTEGDPYEAVFDLRNNTDRYQMAYVNIPLMFGWHFAKQWYFLVGAKYGLNLWGQSNTGDKQTTVTSSGVYEKFIDPFENMQNHEFWTYNRTYKTGTGIISFENNLAASFEIGKYLKIKDNVATRLALFVDYGFMNIHKDRVEGSIYANDPMLLTDIMQPKDLLNLDPALLNTMEGVFNPRYNALLLSGRAYKRTFTPLFIGLKLTVLFKLHEDSNCMCEWY
ncbi:hypothetical protein FACS1894180_4880 [Bacteroidia bacterium]|nr:hypothetical protein FACS1894180_4880 [Bacteroidia bacterium]